ncbi:MAG: DUF1353 domain-containing protein [Candidatus Gastranaerophilaceae bacterium]
MCVVGRDYCEMPSCVVKGRQGLVIHFNKSMPEIYLQDKSLVGLEGKELKRALNKPFYITDDINIVVEYEDRKYYFTIEKGYDWNGANVPAFAWVIIGQQKEPRFKLASCVHDYMRDHKEVVDYNRYLSTLIFETLCEYFGRFNDVKRWAMFHSVDNFQKFKRWMKGKVENEL